VLTSAKRVPTLNLITIFRIFGGNLYWKLGDLRGKFLSKLGELGGSTLRIRGFYKKISNSWVNTDMINVLDKSVEHIRNLGILGKKNTWNLLNNHSWRNFWKLAILYAKLALSITKIWQKTYNFRGFQGRIFHFSGIKNFQKFSGVFLGAIS